jgi:hypothetical protein
VFVVASFNGRTKGMYYHNSVVISYLSLETVEYSGYTVRPAFADMKTRTDFWTYMKEGFAPGIHDQDLRVATNATDKQSRPQFLYLVSGEGPLQQLGLATAPPHDRLSTPVRLTQLVAWAAHR